MPNNSVISEGNTTNEAIENGLKILKVTQDMVNVKVLEAEKKSFFSILAPRVVKVELTLKDEKELKKNKENTFIKKEIKEISPEKIEMAEKNVNEFLDKFLGKVGNNIKYEVNKTTTGLEVYLKGDEAGFLIGYRGETLYSFQTILSSVANKNIDEKIRIWLDIEGYKEKKKKTLHDLAIRIARTVERTKKSTTLEPMQEK